MKCPSCRKADVWLQWDREGLPFLLCGAFAAYRHHRQDLSAWPEESEVAICTWLWSAPFPEKARDQLAETMKAILIAIYEQQEEA